MKDAIAAAREDFERRSRARRDKERRTESRARRGGDGGDLFDGERAFLAGLADECPRCGEFFGVETSRADKVAHLVGCDDAAAHAAHARRREAAAKRSRARDERSEQTDAAQARAVWEAAGGSTSTLWMLPDDALVDLAGGGDDVRGLDRAGLVAAAAAARDAGGRRLLTEDGGSPGKVKRRKLNRTSLRGRRAGHFCPRVAAPPRP